MQPPAEQVVQRGADRCSHVDAQALSKPCYVNAFPQSQSDGQRVAQGQHAGGRGGGGEAHGARLFRRGQDQRHVGGFQQRGARARGDADERNAAPARVQFGVKVAGARITKRWLASRMSVPQLPAS